MAIPHDQDDWAAENDFPMEESYPDFSGKQREFVIELHAQPRRYFLRATEKGESLQDDGHQFAAYSPSDPYFALGILRDKIRRGLATRYLVSDDGRPAFSHDNVQGRIGDGGVVIDGKFISFEQFATLLQTYEGFQFSLKIADPYDEL